MRNTSWLVDADTWFEAAIASARRRGIAAFEATDPSLARAATDDLEDLLEAKRLLAAIKGLLGTFTVDDTAGPGQPPVPEEAAQPATVAPEPAADLPLPDLTRTALPESRAVVASASVDDLTLPDPGGDGSGESGTAHGVAPVAETHLDRDHADAPRFEGESERAVESEDEKAPAPVSPETSAPDHRNGHTQLATPTPNGSPRAAVHTEAPPPPTKPKTNYLSDRTVPSLKELCSRFLDIEELPIWTKADQAKAKALVCDFRAREAEGLDPEEKAVYQEELQRLSELFGRYGDRPDFFGFNASRKPGARAWVDLAESYELLAEAEEAVAWILDNLCSEKDELAIFEMSAAAEALVRRVMDAHFAGAADEQQMDLHERLTMYLKDHKVKVWLPTGTERLSDANTRKEAQGLRIRFANVVESHRKGQEKSRALEALDEVLSDEDVEDFERRLVEAVEKVLEVKVPPSDKTLRAKLMPYRHALGALDSKLGKKLLEYVVDDFNAKSHKAEEAEAGQEVDDETTEIDPDVVAYTKGKVLLMVGGSKGQQRRMQTYKKLFQLEDVVWPDLEPDSNPNEVLHHVPKVDIVAFAIRFSRHRYKLIVDEAKKQGKACVILKAGLGANQFARALQVQAMPAKALG